MKTIRSLMFGLSTAASLSAALVMTSVPAQADGWHHHRGGWNGGAVAAGVIGGLALGALAAGAYSSGPAYYYGPPPAYPAYPVEYGEAYYPHRCYWTVRRVYDDYGYYLGRRRVHICR
jgi:hypothetical protein